MQLWVSLDPLQAHRSSFTQLLLCGLAWHQIWLVFHHGVSIWLILESCRVSGQSSCLSLCQISSFLFCALIGVLRSDRRQGGAAPKITCSKSECVFSWKWEWGLCVCCYARVRMVISTDWLSVCFNCVLTCVSLETKCQTNSLISHFHSVPPCPLFPLPLPPVFKRGSFKTE